MTSWRDLATFIRQQYKVVRDEPDELRIRIRFHPEDEEAEERTQIVVIAREVLDRRDEWIQIATPFAHVDEVDVLGVLTEVGHTTVVGGVVVMGEYLVLRHSLPLANLDLNEFVDPLALVTSSAEMLEEQLTGRDDY
ncbi:hypothetical protein GCM10027445_16020 [Amycolatopsis endophytica]|uniref:YbjN domain-containing protein n=1 Tax=Amycolatopsis endophytica TaxID=860233 RepID=A0A853B5Y7_9PSEU|nr:hypothetical protein [Amycolatopsis endophytica]NYI90184.1 hypothetical protein [Amycolatopsis endophytica]